LFAIEIVVEWDRGVEVSVSLAPPDFLADIVVVAVVVVVPVCVPVVPVAVVVVVAIVVEVRLSVAEVFVTDVLVDAVTVVEVAEVGVVVVLVTVVVLLTVMVVLVADVVDTVDSVVIVIVVSAAVLDTSAVVLAAGTVVAMVNPTFSTSVQSSPDLSPDHPELRQLNPM
jgi:hypothetical protein